VRECRRDRPLFVFGMERDRVLSHKSENWQSSSTEVGCMQAAFSWRLDSSIGVVLESLTGRIPKIISTVLAGKTPGILMNFFFAKKDRRKSFQIKSLCRLRPFAEKSRASGHCTRPEGAALVVRHLSERGLVRGRLDRHASLGGALGAVLKLEGVVRGSRESCPPTSRCRSRRLPRGASCGGAAVSRSPMAVL